MFCSKRTQTLIKYSLYLILFAATTSGLFGCSTVGSLFAVNRVERPKPISNPFVDYHPNSRDSSQNIILRTKKGDRAIELEFPGQADQLSEFVVPVSPAFKDTNRNLASSSSVDGLDETYKDRNASYSDREITSGFSQGQAEDQGKRQEIEEGLNLAPAEGDLTTNAPSYLARLDRIKQLYKLTRYEAALLEADEMLKLYQTDSKLHEMRGTLLDRLGRRELALKSWNQSLHLNPKNEGLKRFIQRRPLIPGGSTP